MRPYLIMVKLVGVSAFLGGLGTVLAAMLTESQPADVARLQMRADLIHRAFVWVIIPGATTAVLAGALLLASVWRPLIRMRWFQAKAILAGVGLPCLHLYLRDRLHGLASGVDSKPIDHSGWDQLSGELIVAAAAALLVGLIIATLGRTKPRLGQDYGRTFARTSDARS